MYHTRYSLQSQRCFYTYPNIVIKMMNFDELIDFKISGVGWSELASIQNNSIQTMVIELNQVRISISIIFDEWIFFHSLWKN